MKESPNLDQRWFNFSFITHGPEYMRALSGSTNLKCSNVSCVGIEYGRTSPLKKLECLRLSHMWSAMMNRRIQAISTIFTRIVCVTCMNNTRLPRPV